MVALTFTGLKQGFVPQDQTSVARNHPRERQRDCYRRQHDESAQRMMEDDKFLTM